MKKLLFIAGLALATSFGANAQTTDQTQTTTTTTSHARGGWKNTPPEQRAKQYTDQMKTQLNLTDDQYGKVLAVNTECIKRKDALRQSGSTDMHGGQREISQYRRQQFATILTPAQMDQLKAMNQQMRQQHGGGRQGGNNMQPGNGDDMTPQQ